MTGKYAYTGIDIDGIGDYLASQTTPTKTINISGKKEGEAKTMYILSQLLGLPVGQLE